MKNCGSENHTGCFAPGRNKPRASQIGRRWFSLFIGPQPPMWPSWL
jgi:hypothetical protein